MNKQASEEPTSSGKSNASPRVGGQALIEGIMMRGPKLAALAVRQKDGGIYVEKWEIPHGKWYQKVPVIRGCFNFFIQFLDGVKYINISADKSGLYDEIYEEEEAKSNKKDGDGKSEEEKNKESRSRKKVYENMIEIFSFVAMFLGIALACVLFFFVPTWGFTGLKYFVKNSGGNLDAMIPFRSTFEGFLKMLLFVGFMAATSLMKDIRKTYEYHGAEHKTIACLEARGELIPENVKNYTRFHPRCGTSFIFLSLVISILFYSIVPINSETLMEVFSLSQSNADIMRIFARMILMPIIVGISYEVIRLAGNHTDKLIMRIISAPGLALQRLTTLEPDEKQIEVAIKAVNIVLGNEDAPIAEHSKPKQKKE